MPVNYDTASLIVVSCGAVWFIVYAGARDKEIRVLTTIIAVVLLLLTACGSAMFFVQQQYCAATYSICRPVEVDWKGLPLQWVISLATIVSIASWLNTSRFRAWAEDVLDGRRRATNFHYALALIWRIQLVIIGFLILSALFWMEPNNASGTAANITLITLLFVMFGSTYLTFRVWLLLSIDQLDKLHRATGIVYAIFPAITCLLALLNARPYEFVIYLGKAGVDVRYACLAMGFGAVALYFATGGRIVAAIRRDLESVSVYTSPKCDVDRTALLRLLDRTKRIIHVIVMITSGTMIGLIAPALHLPDVVGMIIGVGLVSTASYIDEGLSIRPSIQANEVDASD